MHNEEAEDLAFEQLFNGKPLPEEKPAKKKRGSGRLPAPAAAEPKPAAPKAAAPRASAPRKKRGPRRKPGAGVRLISAEASTALHLAALILLLALPQAQPAKAEKPEIIPIEVSFVAQPMAPQKEVAPPGPEVKPVPEPMPAAPEKPAPKPQRQQAAAPKPLPPKPRVNPVKPAPQTQRKAPVQPKAPDLQALLNARQNAGTPSEEQRLAALRDKAVSGADAKTPDTPSGLPKGTPTTSGSGLSGALANRTIARQVNPVYPDHAQRVGDEGQVVVRLWVGPSGVVSRVEVVRSSGRSYFDRAAIAAARQWRFSPMPEGSGEQFGDLPLNFELR